MPKFLSIETAVFVIISLFLFAECQDVYEDDKGKLIFASVIFRHGDRTPYEPYPNDPWRDPKFWPEPFAQLTNVGKQQHYELGQWLRKRYDSLLSERYNASEMFVQSTDVDRTIMSAQSNLAGFYPPKGVDIWNENMTWQPIPIHTLPEDSDQLIAVSKSCKAYDKSFSKVLNTDEIKSILQQNADLFEFLSKNTGEEIKTLQDAEYLYSILNIEDIHGYSLPEWTRDVFPDKLRQIAGLSFAVRTYTPELARFKAGPLLKDILNNARAKIDSPQKQSYRVYSGHDTTIANVLNSLGLFKSMEYPPPPFAAAILFEFRQFDTGSQEVQVFYKNSTLEPKPLFIPGCGTSCPVEKFAELYEKLLPVNWEAECEDVSDGIRNDFLMAASALVFLVGIVGAINFRKARKVESKPRFKIVIPKTLTLTTGVYKQPLTHAFVTLVHENEYKQKLGKPKDSLSK